MDSLLNQTILPSKIVINIPKIYNFRMSHCYISPDKINAFMNIYSKFNVIINFLDEDYGPGTKLLGLLHNNIVDYDNISNTYIILVDDDVIYKQYMVELFDNEIKLKNVEIASFCVYVYNGKKIGQGVDGFLMKLNTLDKFLNYYTIIKQQDYVNYHDDFYISYYFYLLKKTIHYINPPNNCYIYDTHPNTFTDALCKMNDKYSRINLNNKVDKILNKLNENGRFCFLDKTFF